MGLVRGGQRFEAAQDLEHPIIDHDRLGIDRPTVHDAVADRDDVQARSMGHQPAEETVHGVLLRRDLGGGEPFVGDPRAGLVYGEEVGPVPIFSKRPRYNR